MKNKLILLALCATCACTTLRTKSKWMELRSAASVRCTEWPAAQNVLEVSAVHVLDDEPYGFFSMQKLRSGAPAVYWHNFLDPDHFSDKTIQRRDYGRGAKVLGAFSMAKQPYAVLGQREKGKSFIEVRRIHQDYRQVYKSNPFEFDIDDGKIFKSGESIWVVLQTSSEAKSIFVLTHKDGAWDGRLIRNAVSKDAEDIKFAPMPATSALLSATLKQRSAGGDGKLALDLAMLQADGSQAEMGEVTVDAKNQLESWSITSRDQRMLLAFTDGDSLVGQGYLNVVDIALASGVPMVQKQLRLSYPDIHLGEPVWIKRVAGDEVLLPKWLDGEATLGRVVLKGVVSTNELESKGNAGVLPKGSFITSAFRHEIEKDDYFVNRVREGDRWHYQLCRL